MEALAETLRVRRHITIKVVLFQGYGLLDVYGAMEVIAGVASLPSEKGKIRLIFSAAESTAITEGCPAVVTSGLEEGEFDVLFIPGGPGIWNLSDSFASKLGQLAGQAKLVLTVGTGALLLAKSGQLDGCSATTSKGSFDKVAAMHPSVKWQRSARWCIDGKFWTSSGTASSIDLAHHFVHELLGGKAAHLASQAAEYVPITDASDDPFASSPAAPAPSGQLPGRTLKLVLVVYDQFEMLDTFGPLQMFQLTNEILKEQNQPPAFELTTIGEEAQMDSFSGPTFYTDSKLQSLGDKSFDLMLLPGGIGTLREVYAPVMQRTLPQLVERCSKVMTVCTGSAILASMGLLDGLRATTNKFCFDLMALWGPRVSWIPSARWVVDSKYYTSSGVSAGTDLSLALIRELFGQGLAAQVARRAEYVWSADDDGTKDNFTQCIPKATFLHTCYIHFNKAMLRVVFGLGFALGFKMQITRSLL